MLKEWQFNVLFWVGVGGAVLILIGPEFGLDFGQTPMSAGGIGAILTYILTQKQSITKSNGDKKKKKDTDETQQGGGG